jgi:hypothetical protein
MKKGNGEIILKTVADLRKGVQNNVSKTLDLAPKWLIIMV